MYEISGFVKLSPNVFYLWVLVLLSSSVNS